jgi:invasion protein IalB
MKDLPDGRGGKIITIRWIMTSRKISKIEKLQCLLSNILINQKKRENTLIAVVSLFKENWLYEKFSLILFGN